MSYFPMMVELENKKVLVVGGGEEGRKKVEILHSFGADITLVATAADEEAVKLSSAFYQRGFQDDDIDKNAPDMIVAATDDRELNRHISCLAARKRIPVNIVDDTELCSFIFPAIIKEGEVVCSVSSGGRSPYVAQYVKSLIRKVLPEGIGEINERMGQFRKQAKDNIADPAKRRSFLRAKLDELLGGREHE